MKVAGRGGDTKTLVASRTGQLVRTNEAAGRPVNSNIGVAEEDSDEASQSNVSSWSGFTILNVRVLANEGGIVANETVHTAQSSTISVNPAARTAVQSMGAGDEVIAHSSPLAVNPVPHVQLAEPGTFTHVPVPLQAVTFKHSSMAVQYAV
jgi:hypothetical protein